MTPNRIVFTGDFLRPNYQGQAPTQHYNIQWCRDLLARQMAIATGLDVKLACWNSGGVRDGQFDVATVRAIYAAHGLDVSLTSWANLYDNEVLPDNVAWLYGELFSDAIVVAFELPPYLEAFLRKHGIPFVNVIIHPVRFLDDLYLGFQTNIPAIAEKLTTYVISEEFVAIQAGLQTAAARRQFAFAASDNSALLLLQTTHDRTQIRDGGFIGASHFVDEISDISKAYRKIYLKKHPLEPGNVHAELIMSKFSNVEPVHENVYRLFATPGVERVFSLSSSTGLESPYFNVPSEFLYKSPAIFAYDGALPLDDQYVGVFDAFLNADFWREILESLVAVTPLSGVRIPFKPNRLRTSIRSFWSFNEIDTDYMVSIAPK